jgi:hypothetical protein
LYSYFFLFNFPGRTTAPDLADTAAAALAAWAFAAAATSDGFSTFTLAASAAWRVRAASKTAAEAVVASNLPVISKKNVGLFNKMNTLPSWA